VFVEQLVRVVVSLVLDGQEREARADQRIGAVRLQEPGHPAPVAGVAEDREPLIPRVLVLRIQRQHSLEPLARHPLTIVAAEPEAHLGVPVGRRRITRGETLGLPVGLCRLEPADGHLLEPRVAEDEEAALLARMVVRVPLRQMDGVVDLPGRDQ